MRGEVHELVDRLELERAAGAAPHACALDEGSGRYGSSEPLVRVEVQLHGRRRRVRQVDVMMLTGLRRLARAEAPVAERRERLHRRCERTRCHQPVEIHRHASVRRIVDATGERRSLEHHRANARRRQRARLLGERQLEVLEPDRVAQIALLALRARSLGQGDARVLRAVVEDAGEPLRTREPEQRGPVVHARSRAGERLRVRREGEPAKDTRGVMGHHGGDRSPPWAPRQSEDVWRATVRAAAGGVTSGRAAERMNPTDARGHEPRAVMEDRFEIAPEALFRAEGERLFVLDRRSGDYLEVSGAGVRIGSSRDG